MENFNKEIARVPTDAESVKSSGVRERAEVSNDAEEPSGSNEASPKLVSVWAWKTSNKQKRGMRMRQGSHVNDCKPKGKRVEKDALKRAMRMRMRTWMMQKWGLETAHD